MIVFAAIVPHTPLLAPSVGKEHAEKHVETLRAYKELAESLYLAKPDSIVIISPHAPLYPDAFSGNVAQKFTGVLKDFGDHGTTIPVRADFLLLDHIHRGMRQENTPFTMTSAEELDYAITIPLLLLGDAATKPKLAPIGISGLDARAHFDFGSKLKNVLQAENGRIAIIASADLSHRVNPNSPQGALPEGEAFDKFVREKVMALDGPGFLAADADMVEKAQQSGYKPIAIMLGALDGMNVKPKELAYEAPFGVGLMTVRFDLA